ncbi:YqeG family HAD IIIA-type phosphatase [Thermanaeromonas sp. C210]|uniref:YqeG family HAD IIIA-type phosphatase n=1 Tax=Thermanaeromonas sp. C210 TaxID=2731925 RepID=UPI00155C9591|nr:YqeG family HAD IIIA-type phosphatase [Thermanaeromonas sp. C210]GFN23284.1 haloacid dehalogenase [Thermanaeromonas sp. C210]
MLKYLRPDLYVKSLLRIPLEELSRRGIRGLIIDLDNTVTEWNRLALDREVQEWFCRLNNYNLKACLLSNNRQKRVHIIGHCLGIPALSSAGKPRAAAFYRAMEVLGTRPEETAVIGDQLFTDVLGGKRLGLYTILAVPLDKREFIGTRFIRLLERVVLKWLALGKPL